MNRKIGMLGSVVNICSVGAFALYMLLPSDMGSFFSCMFIAFSFVPMICSFCIFCNDDRKAAGYSAMVFSGIYAVIILLVYYAQLTAVRNGGLDDSAKQLLNYNSYGLFFAYDMLGYGLMALATFFAGFTIECRTKADRWLKWLLHIHGIFFISCLIIPMLGIFRTDMAGGRWTGIVVLEIWCAYFIPVGVLSFLYFKSKK